LIIVLLDAIAFLNIFSKKTSLGIYEKFSSTLS